MEIRETAQLLALIRVGDNRNVDQATIAMWHDVVADLDLQDALTAVRAHRRTSVEYLMPAHVVAGVRGIQRARLAAAPPPLPAVDPDDVAAYQAERRRLIAAVASGKTNPNQIGA